MHDISETTRVILLPREISSLDIIRVKCGESLKSVAIFKDHVFEIREVGTPSEFDSRNEPMLPNGEPVKSLILESSRNQFPGAILSRPNVAVLTKFDFVFIFLSWVATRLEVYTSRFYAIDDLTESFLEWSDSLGASKLFEGIIKCCVDRTCESIQESGEKFYKFSLKMTNNLLSQKIEQLKRLLSQNPDYVLSKRIKESLSGEQQDIPEMVLQQQITRYCTDLVFSLILGSNMKGQYIRECGEDFTELEAYLKDQDIARKNMMVADDHLATLSTQKKNEMGRGRSKNSKPNNAMKKKPSKVAIGKGALDIFFKKN